MATSDADLPSFDERRLSFGAMSGDYDRYRPSYPAESVDWALAAADRTVEHVADVGAGTGALTRLLAQRGLQIEVVDPDDGMLAQLKNSLPSVQTHVAAAEHLPLDDASVDGVLVAQAWHWFDHDAASAEFGRVVAPGGLLAVFRNLRHLTFDWTYELARLIRDDDWQTVEGDAASVGGYELGNFGPQWSDGEWAQFSFDVQMTAESLIGLISTFSYVRLREDSDQIMAALRKLAYEHPDLAGRENFPMPYVTAVCRATRL